MTTFTLRVSNFRAIEELEWSPRGLCVLSGPNGAGKTTVLDALRFLQLLFRWGHDSALRRVGGASFLRLGVPRSTPVTFALEVGELAWTLTFPMSSQGLGGHYGEELRDGDRVVLRANLHQDHWFIGTERLDHGEELRCAARVLWDRGDSQFMAPLVDLLLGLRLHDTYWLNQVQRVEPVSQGDTHLHSTGKNLWSVLANWRASPRRYPGRFQWVIDKARQAFPGIAGTVEFDRGIPYLFGPDASDGQDGLLPDRAAAGHLTGLLHLTAIAGAREGALLAFDEVENQLHPHALRVILDAFGELCEERNLTVVVTTHSPVVLNELSAHPGQIHVLRDGRGPTPLDALHDPDWLAHFSLGELYEREVFAQQHAPGTPA